MQEFGRIAFALAANVALSLAANAQSNGDVDSWTAWAEAHGAHVEKVVDGRLLFVAPTKKSSVHESLELLKQTISTFDDLFGAPDGAQPTATLLDLPTSDAFDAAMDEIARLNPWSQGWSKGMSSHPTDFVLEQPAVAGLAFFAGAHEQWDPANELVHRAARLLLIQRFGHEPHWLATGLAWTIEQRVRGTLYCFPGREGFVSVNDHAGWGTELATIYKSKKLELSYAELAALAPNAWSPAAAARAWGGARFLAEEHAALLGELCADFAARWETDSRDTKPDGSWTRKPNFEVALDAQLEILEKHTSKDVLKQMVEAFRDPKRFAAPNPHGVDHAQPSRSNAQR